MRRKSLSQKPGTSELERIRDKIAKLGLTELDVRKIVRQVRRKTS